MKAEKKFKAVVDRIEGQKAVVLMGEEEREAAEISLPFLPEGTKESDILTFKIKLESRRTKEAKEKVALLIEKLKKKGG
ncbi:MAG TPA: DUF3006 domain-containing protein [Candidatus Omnitrophota bacterium]|nr:DUF3006 domain-containing protein [Candidatus Omnitrophota bacterium]